MCPKVVKIYHQTFRNGDATKNEQQFAFQRIYKTKQVQYFKVKLLGITGGQHLIDTKNLLFMKGIPEVTTFGNFEEIDSAGNITRRCDFYLGNLNDRDYLDVELIVDEIPLTPFKLYCDAACAFSVSFQIELVNP